MQERRTTVRYDCPRRAQYCSTSDLIPRDGRVTSLTERGIGLMAHEPHEAGERLTVTFTLPGEEDAVTTTGVVRWSRQAPTPQRWFPLGLEWLPLEETTRFRLDTFLRDKARERALGPWSVSGAVLRRWKPSAVHWGALAVAALGITGALSARIVWLRWENSQLTEAIQHRNLAIAQLRESEQYVQQRLDATAAQLTQVLGEVVQLEQRSGQFQGELQRLAAEAERFQAAYATLHEQREGFVRQIVDLERERAQMVQRLTSIPIIPAQ